ncbi:uncharacterized protein PHALS_02899 [Plasmopara halstedii]|uniref:Uncharacterized protein n=1 Tax=Plasmopara halstedii TaxID=4781 RepID=A0A0N7L7A1_PLAHL|nr:uncharacterized protein PHALS_02899 [Plasmopara halstedii]CEG46499.1 hypothetical protein PHALS_02899 [Plasmopara halstedii]|eukprot:XP_024582868.1 hypothetical protein PHALS_02899 [Plasmopara halstedii]
MCIEWQSTQFNEPTRVVLSCAAAVNAPDIFADTANELNVPALVIFGCAAVVSAPKMFSDSVSELPSAQM